MMILGFENCANTYRHWHKESLNTLTLQMFL